MAVVGADDREAVCLRRLLEAGDALTCVAGRHAPKSDQLGFQVRGGAGGKWKLVAAVGSVAEAEVGRYPALPCAGGVDPVQWKGVSGSSAECLDRKRSAPMAAQGCFPSFGFVSVNEWREDANCL